MNYQRFWAACLACALGAAQVAAADPPNLRRAAEGVYVGGSPTDAAAWDALAQLRVRTVVGVDGLPPDRDAAQQIAARVVHIPLGYGGIDNTSLVQLGRVAQVAERPIYVFCHHGRHRGPAAAAVICRAAGLMDRGAATQLLHDAGTDPRYAALWRDAEQLRVPDQSGTPPRLAERSAVPPLRLAMSQLDQAWDAVVSGTDPAGREHALLLATEAMKESRRAAMTARKSEALVSRFSESLTQLRGLRATPTSPTKSREFVEVGRSCHACHARFRDTGR